MKKVLLIVLGITMLTLTGCESCSRSMKSLNSDFNGGLNRKITVYSQSGEKLREYSGKFDIETSAYGNKVLFDLNSKRVIIYNAIVISEEN